MKYNNRPQNMIESFERIISQNMDSSESLMNPEYNFPDVDATKLTGRDAWNYNKLLSSFSLTMMPSHFAKSGIEMTYKELFDRISDPRYKNIEKRKRPLVMGTTTETRPTGDAAFLNWSGWQVIDMDIKNREIAMQLKELIFKELNHNNWLVGVILSTSGNGLHIYTHVKIHEVFRDDLERLKRLYYANYRHKYSVIFWTLHNAGIKDEDILKWMDNSMARPAQGTYIPYDEKPLFNTNFYGDYINVCFVQKQFTGSPMDFLLYEPLQVIFKHWDYCTSDMDTTPEIVIKGGFRDTVYKSNIKDVKPVEEVVLEEVKGKKHYKHAERWKLANTLVNLFEKDGDAITTSSKSFLYMKQICIGTPDKELLADCRTAARYKKPVSKWAVDTLNKNHNFDIKYNVVDNDIDTELKDGDVPDSIISNKEDSVVDGVVTLHREIGENEYIADVKDEIVEVLDKYRSLLLEAGPGMGKTEFVKSLTQSGKRVIMVEPFTSIIKSKVESKTDDWVVSYANKRIDPLEFFAVKKAENKGAGLVITSDKYAHLNIVELKDYIDYVFIDESHLIFLSSYRPCMAEVYKQIHVSITYGIKTVYMTGTPVAEHKMLKNDFLPCKDNILPHLVITRPDHRNKYMKFNVLENYSDVSYTAGKFIAEEIAKGNKVLFPSNRGNVYFCEMVTIINYFLQRIPNAACDTLKTFYYKKSNAGSEDMHNVDQYCTFGDNNLIMCSTYMSAGVDVKDQLKDNHFEIVFTDVPTPAECDQWCNRLRNNDLILNIYISKNDSLNRPIHIGRVIPMEEIFDGNKYRTDVMAAIDMVNKRARDIYDPIVSDKIATYGKFMIKDNILDMHIINEIAFQLDVFEKQYRSYTIQPKVFIYLMKKYGYNFEVIEAPAFVCDDERGERLADVERDVKDMRAKVKSESQEHIDDLLEHIDESILNIYKETMQGGYMVIKGDDYTEDHTNRILTVKDVDIFNIIIPILVSLNRFFHLNTVKLIFESCKTKKKYNITALKRWRDFMILLSTSRNCYLDGFVTDYIHEIRELVDNNNVITKDLVDQFISSKAEEYINTHKSEHKSEAIEENTRESFKKIFNCLVDVSRKDKQGNVKLNRRKMEWDTRDDERMKERNCNIYTADDLIEEVSYTDIQVSSWDDKGDRKYKIMPQTPSDIAQEIMWGETQVRFADTECVADEDTDVFRSNPEYGK